MCNENEWIVREAFLAYDRGDFARMMEFVDPGLQWTYLDPGPADTAPQVCHGREELERVLRRQADDRTYDVVTVKEGRIIELHACRDHSEARTLAGIG